MRIFVLGATGKTGLHVLQQGVERGHRMTAFVRSPDKIDIAGVEKVKGDPRDAAAIAAALRGHDAVVSCLGPPGLGASTIVADGARAAVAAMKEVGVKRAIFVSVAVLFRNAGLLVDIVRATFLRNVTKDSGEMERIVRASDLDWTLPRPPRVVQGALTKAYRVEVDRLPASGRRVVTFADVAHFMLEELEQRRYVRQIVGMAEGP